MDTPYNFPAAPLLEEESSAHQLWTVYTTQRRGLMSLVSFMSFLSLVSFLLSSRRDFFNQVGMATQQGEMS